MNLEIIKPLLESGLISEETSASITEAWGSLDQAVISVLDPCKEDLNIAPKQCESHP